MTERFLMICGGLVLISLLAGANLIGNLSAYAYIAVLVLAFPFLLADPDFRAKMWRWESMGYAFAFIFLAIPFVVTANSIADLENLGNFLPFLLFIPAVALLSVLSGVQASAVLGGLALTGALISLGVALYEVRVLGMGRAQGLINLTNPFAMASVMLGFLALVGFFATKGPIRFTFWFGPIAGSIAAVLAGTRAAMVMVACLGLIFLVFWVVSLDRRGKLVLAIVSVFVALGAIALVWALNDQLRAFSAFETIALFFQGGNAIDNSTEIRISLYYSGIRAFLDAPLFGHGWFSHMEAASAYMTPSIAERIEHWVHLHNDFINFAAMAGIFGVAAYLLYMSIPVAGALKASKDSQYLARLYGAFVLACSYAVFGLFDTSFAAEMLLCFGPIYTAALLGFCVDGERAMESSSEPIS